MRELGNLDDLMLINDGTNPDKYEDDCELNYAMNKGGIYLKNFIYGGMNYKKKNIIKGGVITTENGTIITKDIVDDKIIKYQNDPLKLIKIRDEFSKFDLSPYDDAEERQRDEVLINYATGGIDDMIDKNFKNTNKTMDEKYNKLQKKIKKNKYSIIPDIKPIIKPIIESSYPPNFEINLMKNFNTMAGAYGVKFENAYEKTFQDAGINILNNNKHPFYSKPEFKILNKKISEWLPYDMTRDKRMDELKAYNTQYMVKLLDDESKINNKGPGVFMQLSKFGFKEINGVMKPGDYIPVFKNDVNGNFKLFNVKDTKFEGYTNGRKSREYINDKKNNNIDFYMVYLLKDGLYEIKINDPNVFFFKNGDGKYNGFKVFELDDIKKKFKVCKDTTIDSNTKKITQHQCIWIPLNMLNKI